MSNHNDPADPTPGENGYSRPTPPAQGPHTDPYLQGGYGSADPSSPGGDHTTWYGQDRTAPQPLTQQPDPWAAYTGSPQPAGAGQSTMTTTRSRRLLEVGTAAVLAGVLAGGGVYAATANRTDSASSSSLTASSSGFTPNTAQPVVQAEANAPDWSATAGAVTPSVVSITISRGGQKAGEGSGVILDAAGHVVTNNHVASAGGANGTLSITLSDLRTYDAKIVGLDPATDLAVLQIEGAPTDLKPIALGDANQLKVGDPVMAVGNPLGLAGTVTTGIVSALNRPVSTNESQDGTFGQAAEPVVTNAVQTSAAINPGNSGGALVNANGQLVGINSSIASTSSSGGNIGIGFAIPVNEAKSVADQLISKGKATHAYLGVTPNDGVVKEGDAKVAAATVQNVGPDTPAAKAGLKVGDAVVAVDGEPINGRLALVAQIRERNVGDQVTLAIVRDGKRSDLKVTLTSRPTS